MGEAAGTGNQLGPGADNDWVGGRHWLAGWLGFGCRHIEIVARERRHWLAGWVLAADILLTGREIVPG